MIGLDCNILIQIAFADHPANTRTVAAVKAEVGRGSKLIIPPLILTEFLHIVTDARRFDPPFSMDEALQWLDAFMATPAVRLLPPNDASVRQTVQWMRQYQLGRKRVLDTHLAAIFYVNGIRRLMTSNPGDFGVFAAFEIVTP